MWQRMKRGATATNFVVCHVEMNYLYGVETEKKVSLSLSQSHTHTHMETHIRTWIKWWGCSSFTAPKQHSWEHGIWCSNWARSMTALTPSLSLARSLFQPHHFCRRPHNARRELIYSITELQFDNKRIIRITLTKWNATLVLQFRQKINTSFPAICPSLPCRIYYFISTLSSWLFLPTFTISLIFFFYFFLLFLHIFFSILSNSFSLNGKCYEKKCLTEWIESFS